MRKLILILAVALGVAACTPQEVATWLGKPVSEVTEEEVEEATVAWEAYVGALRQQEQQLRNHPFLVCTRRIESGGNYAAVNPSGTYRGAYQFARRTWDGTARAAGRPDLVGVDPAAAPPNDQDRLAMYLARQEGARPWLGRCSQHL